MICRGKKAELFKKLAKDEKRTSARNVTKPQKNAAEDDLSDEDNILDEEQARIVSVLLFAIGILLGLAVFITGSDGWEKFHNFILGIFGLASLAVPPMVIYSAVIIAGGKPNGRKTIAWMIFWIIIICTSVQVFFVGIPPKESFGAYIKMVYQDGAEFKGGGVAGAPVSGLLLWGLGRVGAVIVSMLMIFVIALISSGKELMDFLRSLTKPFASIKRCIDGVQNVMMDRDFDDDYAEDYDDVTDVPKISMADDNQKLIEEKPMSPAERRERDEFSRQFDIPLPGDNIRIHNTEEKKADITQDAPEKNPSEHDKANSELDMIISKAAEKKAEQDRLAAGEIIEPKKPGNRCLCIYFPVLIC